MKHLTLISKENIIYLPILGIILAVIALVLNVLTFHFMRIEKTFSSQTWLLGSINISRVMLCFITCLWWVAWHSFHGRSFEKSTNIIIGGVYIFHMFSVLSLTADRLIEVTSPLQYKALPTDMIHRCLVLASVLIGSVSAIVFLCSYKDSSIKAYFTLVLNALSIIINSVGFAFISKRWNNRLNLAKKLGGIGRALQRLDAKVMKTAFFIAFCGILAAIAGVVRVSLELTFPADKTKMAVGLLSLFCTGLYILQPLFCLVIGVDLSSKRKKQGLFVGRVGQRKSWRNL